MSSAKAGKGAPSSVPPKSTASVTPRKEIGLKAGRRATDGAEAVPQLALRIKDAAQALGISVESFERYVQGDLKLLRLGKMRLVPTYELQRFIDQNAYRIGGDW